MPSLPAAESARRDERCVVLMLSGKSYRAIGAEVGLSVRGVKLAVERGVAARLVPVDLDAEVSYEGHMQALQDEWSWDGRGKPTPVPPGYRSAGGFVSLAEWRASRKRRD